MRQTVVRLVALAFAGSLAVVTSACQRGAAIPASVGFEHVTVDRSGPVDPWGKSVGDIDGDGRPDLVVGGYDGGGLVWYQNPAWRKHVIAAEGAFSTDHEVADIDSDGRNDIVSVMEDRLVWFRHGSERWIMEEIDRRRLHDVEVSDLDGDGRPDVIARGQSAFGDVGTQVHLYFRLTGGGWQTRTLEVPDGEGLKVHDLHGDGRPDLVVNGLWLENPGRRAQAWRRHVFTRRWTWPHAYIAVNDINGDGRMDIAMSPAETAKSRYRISWFEAPRDPENEWTEHVIDPDVEAVHHFIGIADFDMDGRVDVASAMMHQGRPPAEVKVYLNEGNGRRWSKQVLSTNGSHSMRIADIDGDGDPDLFGANWSGKSQQPELWINAACQPDRGCPCWRRHEIDSARPDKAVFIHAADLDGDGLRDVAAGAWWYRNPGRPVGEWERRAFGAPAFDVVLLADLDGDGDADALATRWREDDPDARLVFAENDGHGNFRRHVGLPIGAGDFLQGVALARLGDDGLWRVALSWHAPGQGIELLTVPKQPATEKWRIERIAKISQDEALSVGDVDWDGRLDLLLGTRWLRNEGKGGWSAHVIDPERDNPDRNRLADIDGDGRLDAVVGFEAISVAGDVVWYQQGSDPRKPWKRHPIGTAIGPMSLDVADFDADGAFDVVVGEHNLHSPETARLMLFENLDGRGLRWREHVVHVGDEHHDGALAMDIDGDGDFDVLSIGWGHGKVLMYENLMSACRATRYTQNR